MLLKGDGTMSYKQSFFKEIGEVIDWFLDL